MCKDGGEDSQQRCKGKVSKALGSVKGGKGSEKRKYWGGRMEKEGVV